MRSFLRAPRYFSVLIAVTIFNVAAFAQSTAQSPFPAPMGPYSVGRAYFDWIDPSRPDPDSPSKHREVVVWVWYPASPKPGAEPAEWMPGKWGELFWSEVVTQKLPEVAAHGKQYPINTIRSHSYTDSPLASSAKTYPVLLFEPGLGNVPLLYTSLIEDIVSHGYIVAGVVPTYYTTFGVFSDGRVAADHRGEIHGPPGVEMTLEDAKARMASVFKFWTGDMIFTLNQLEKENVDAASRFKGRLNLKQVGAFGHSLGGPASLQVANDDSRVGAAININGGPVAGQVFETGLRKPFLIFLSSSPDHPLTNAPEGLEVLLKSGKPAYLLALNGSTHSSCSDLGMLPFVPKEARAEMGGIDSVRAISAFDAYVDAFFGEYLQGNKSTLLNGPSPQYPEITEFVFRTTKDR